MQAADFLDDHGAVEELCDHFARWLFEDPAGTRWFCPMQQSVPQLAAAKLAAREQCGRRAQVRPSQADLDLSLHACLCRHRLQQIR